MTSSGVRLPLRVRALAVLSTCWVLLMPSSNRAETAVARPASSTPASSLPSPSWPADSVYQVDARLQMSSGGMTSFATANARTRIVTMFYAHCPMACPLTLDTLRNLDSALSPVQRARLDVLLLSMDPERDTPEVLRALAQERHLDERRWILGRASGADTRKLAAVLGIQYRVLDNGEFDHSSVFVLLDARGRVIARSRKLGVPAVEFVAAVKAALDRDNGDR